MQEEANRESFTKFRGCFGQHSRQKHEVVVMNPYKVAIRDIGRKLLGESLIDSMVCLPFVSSKLNCVGLIME